LIVRLDEPTPAYHLVVDRSLAAYVWAALTDAMQEFLD
jgi:sarcosine oxidase gamma subunit